MTALDKQVDGRHYNTMKVQPVQLAYAIANGDSCACKLFKYTQRKKDDMGVQLEKAIHCVELKRQLCPIGHELSASQRFMLDCFVEQAPANQQESLKEIYELFLAGYFEECIKEIQLLKNRIVPF